MALFSPKPPSATAAHLPSSSSSNLQLAGTLEELRRDNDADSDDHDNNVISQLDDSLEQDLNFFGEIFNPKQQMHGNHAKNENTVSAFASMTDEVSDNRVHGDCNVAQNFNTQPVEEMKSLRKRLGLHVKGHDIPDAISNFSELEGRYKVPKYLLNNLGAAKPVGFGFEAPTPIQAQAVPCLLSKQDVLACAPTGSGKTIAFALPMLHRLVAPRKDGVRGLVLTPTAELGQQLKRQIQKLARGRAFRILMLSKSNATENTFKNSRKRDILVATPLRLLSLIRAKKLHLESVVYLTLDEADRLFEDGFIEQVDEILAACPNSEIQRALFSATMPQGVEILARTVLRNPTRIVVGYKNAAARDIDQKLIFVGSEQGKPLAMRQLIQKGLKIPTLCFVQSVDRARQLFNELVFDGINVDVIHSQRTTKQREAIVEAFRTGRIWMLIATDLMARGVDFKGVNCVINYDIPQSTVTYIHRIGRTGRAGRKGEAITFFTEKDAKYVQGIAVIAKKSGAEMPEWLLSVEKATKSEMVKFQMEAPNRERISREKVSERGKLSKGKKKRKATARKKRRASVIEAKKKNKKDKEQHGTRGKGARRRKSFISTSETDDFAAFNS